MPRWNASPYDPGADFQDGNLYVFAYAPDDTIAAHSVNPDLIGREVAGFKDVDRRHFAQEILERATPEGAWIN